MMEIDFPTEFRTDPFATPAEAEQARVPAEDQCTNGPCDRFADRIAPDGSRVCGACDDYYGCTVENGVIYGGDGRVLGPVAE